MTVFLGILLTILKGIGILLLVILLALLLLLVFLPVMVRVHYAADECRVVAYVGPRSFLVMGEKNPKGPGKSTQKASKKKSQDVGKGKDSSRKQSGADSNKDNKNQEENSRLPDFLQRRMDAVLAMAKSDPLTLAERALCHGAGVFNLLLHGLKVRHLTVYWPVTGSDAADTALRYGATITAANNLLLILRRHMKIKADSLQMEADFTAEHAPQKLVAFDVKTTPGILLVIVLRAVHRVWVDPALQPAAKAA